MGRGNRAVIGALCPSISMVPKECADIIGDLKAPQFTSVKYLVREALGHLAPQSEIGCIAARGYSSLRDHGERLDPGWTPPDLDQGEIDVGVLGPGVVQAYYKGTWEVTESRPSVISRLYSAYATARDQKLEKSLLQQLKSNAIRKYDNGRT